MCVTEREGMGAYVRYREGGNGSLCALQRGREWELMCVTEREGMGAYVRYREGGNGSLGALQRGREWELRCVTEREGMGAYVRYREGGNGSLGALQRVTGNDPSVSRACREAEDLGVRGLWVPDPRPVHHAGGAGPGMARRLPQVRRLLAVPGRVVHVLRSRRQDVLQARLLKVRWTEPRSIVQELCESRGGRPGLSVLMSLLVSVDVKLY